MAGGVEPGFEPVVCSPAPWVAGLPAATSALTGTGGDDVVVGGVGVDDRSDAEDRDGLGPQLGEVHGGTDVEGGERLGVFGCTLRRG